MTKIYAVAVFCVGLILGGIVAAQAGGLKISLNPLKPKIEIGKTTIGGSTPLDPVPHVTTQEDGFIADVINTADEVTHAPQTLAGKGVEKAYDALVREPLAKAKAEFQSFIDKLLAGVWHVTLLAAAGLVALVAIGVVLGQAAFAFIRMLFVRAPKHRNTRRVARRRLARA